MDKHVPYEIVLSQKTSGNMSCQTDTQVLPSSINFDSPSTAGHGSAPQASADLLPSDHAGETFGYGLEIASTSFNSTVNNYLVDISAISNCFTAGFLESDTLVELPPVALDLQQAVPEKSRETFPKKIDTASQASASFLSSDPAKDMFGDSLERTLLSVDSLDNNILTSISAVPDELPAIFLETDSYIDSKPVETNQKSFLPKYNDNQCLEIVQTAGETIGARKPLSVITAVSGRAKGCLQRRGCAIIPGKYGEDAYFIVQNKGSTFMGECC